MNDRVLGHEVESTALTHTSTTLSDSETVYDVTTSSTTVSVCVCVCVCACVHMCVSILICILDIDSNTLHVYNIVTIVTTTYSYYRFS